MAERRTLKRRLLRLVVGVLSLVAFCILGLVFWLNLRSENARLAQIEQQVRANIASKANVLVENQALALRGLVADNAFTDVRKMVDTAVADDPDLVYGCFVSSDGTPWAYSSPTTPHVRPEDAVGRLSELGLGADTWKSNVPTQRLATQFGQELLEVSRPVADEGEVMGVVRYGFSTTPLQKALEQVRVESRATLEVMLLWLTLAVLSCTVIGVYLMSQAAARITKPLIALTAATDRIAQGERGVRVVAETSDELGALAVAFNNMQQANEDAMQRLSDAMEAALEASRLKSEFLANMSHEIRTPMNGVIGMIRLILKLPLEGKMRRYAETVDASASALMTIINDVLDFSKMEAGKYTLQEVPFDPSLVLQEVAELLSGRAYEKELELVYRRANDVPGIVIGDPDRFRQILNNLIGNAIKFSDRGEIYVELTLDAEGSDGHTLRTVVQDNGIGIAQADQEKLFDAFSQVDGSMVRQHGGTGLGLAISKRLAEMMGGSIGVMSEPGIGSKFWFTVAVGRSDAPSRLSLLSLPRGRRALVVEASRRWCRIIEEHLVAWGLSCDVFQDGRPALRQLETVSEPYDIAVVGAQLRDISIEEFVAQLRQRPNARSLPLIALTQLGAGATLTEVEHEVAAQIAKPLRLSELYDCIVGTFVGTGVPAPRPRAQARAVRNRGKTILVVDDNEINQFVATEQLESAGFRTDTASNGQEALEKATRDDYAAILMDCQMPVMDGYTAARKIREWEGDERHVPIIALTAHAMAGERDKVLCAGMDDYLSKPLRAHALERMLDRYIDDAADHTESRSTTAPAGKLVELDMTIRRSPKLVSLFIARVPENLEALDAAIADLDPKATREQAHKLKGSCLAVGAELMAKEAEDLQHEAESHALSNARERARRLWNQYDRVTALLSSEPSVAAHAQPPDAVSAE